MSAVNKDGKTPHANMLLLSLMNAGKINSLFFRCAANKAFSGHLLFLQFVDLLNYLFRIKIMHHGTESY